MNSKLFIIPTPIADEGWDAIPLDVVKTISHVRVFLVENEKVARRFLKKIIPNLPLTECQFFVLDEHSSPKESKEFFLKINQDAGLLSENGCPCVADPGADIVRLAHERGMEIVPLIGPSSIMLALMASGLNGQNFAFNGYLPKDREQRLKKIKSLEQRSSQEQQTQIFMETPYHNDSLFKEIISCCALKTYLCVAADLTSPAQFIKTFTIEEWRKTSVPSLNKKPALFLLFQTRAQ